jgi:Protein of unknown function (DUF1566)
MFSVQLQEIIATPSEGFFMNQSFFPLLRAAFGQRSSAAFLCLLLAASAKAQQVCNANIPLTRPDSRYEVVVGATPAGSEVRDKVTGLIWQRCLFGMSWNGSTCFGNLSPRDWIQAIEVARLATPTSANPTTPWRLPERDELASLTEKACHNPAINAKWFPRVPSAFPGYFAWSASQYAGSNFAWIVYFKFGDGGHDLEDKGVGLSVRLVRSGQ